MAQSGATEEPKLRQRANSPYERLARGEAFFGDYMTHRPEAYDPSADARLIFAIAFEKEDQAIWAFKNGATGEGAVARCLSNKEETEKSYSVGICEKVEKRLETLIRYERSYRRAILGLGAAVILAAQTLYCAIRAGKWAVNKYKAA